jgi:hypothetical protein
MTWRSLPGEQWTLYSPIGLRLVDAFTRESPMGQVTATLDLRDGTAWSPTDIAAIRTPGGILIYPGLGRTRDPGSQPARHYRVRVESPLYRAEYPKGMDGVEFDAHPFDDVAPPAVIVRAPIDLVLRPSPAYQYTSNIRVIRGLVTSGGQAATDALVTAPHAVPVLTDERGTFGLPLVSANVKGPIKLKATDRSGRSVTANLKLPDALDHGQKLLIP